MNALPLILSLLALAISVVALVTAVGVRSDVVKGLGHVRKMITRAQVPDGDVASHAARRPS